MASGQGWRSNPHLRKAESPQDGVGEGGAGLVETEPFEMSADISGAGRGQLESTAEVRAGDEDLGATGTETESQEAGQGQ